MPNSGDMIERARKLVFMARNRSLPDAIEEMAAALRSAPLSSLPQEDDRELVERLHAVTAHGDQEHRDWLREAYAAFFAGKPVPAPRGSGRKEKLIREQADRLLQLSRDVDLLRELLDEAFDLLGGVDDAAELRGKILGVLPPVSSGISEQGEM